MRKAGNGSVQSFCVTALLLVDVTQAKQTMSSKLNTTCLGNIMFVLLRDCSQCRKIKLPPSSSSQLPLKNLSVRSIVVNEHLAPSYISGACEVMTRSALCAFINSSPKEDL